MEVRLQKWLADQGLCSRREGEQWIAEGKVKVNGHAVPLGTKIDPEEDQVTVQGKGLLPRKKKNAAPPTLLMHKPRGALCSHEDPYHESTVFDLLPPEYKHHRLLIAGRLDKESEGMLILTGDGDLCHRLTHPSGGAVKRYRVTLHRAFDTVLIPKLLKGIKDEGELLKAEKVIPAGEGEILSRKIEVHLSHGRKREIRRLLDAFGFKVVRLQRFQIGRLQMRRLAPGQCRLLKPDEIDLLFG